MQRPLLSLHDTRIQPARQTDREDKDKGKCKKKGWGGGDWGVRKRELARDDEEKEVEWNGLDRSPFVPSLTLFLRV